MNAPLFSINPANVLTLVVAVWIAGVLAIVALAYKHPMPRTIHTIPEPVPSIPITEHVPEVNQNETQHRCGKDHNVELVNL